MRLALPHDPNYVTLARSDYDWLNSCYWSPISGMRDVAENLLIEWGHDPAAHPALLDAMELELSGALIETAADLIRDHGLRDHRVEPAAAPAP
jgi:hypothetical protein